MRSDVVRLGDDDDPIERALANLPAESPESDPMGDPEGKIDNLTEEQIVERLKDMPVAQLWWMIIRPRKSKATAMSKGTHGASIVLATVTKDADDAAESHLNYVGQVLGMGPLCGHNDSFLDSKGANQYRVKVGDWITYNRYQGMRIVHRGITLLLIKDEYAMTTVKDPDVLKVFV